MNSRLKELLLAGANQLQIELDNHKISQIDWLITNLIKTNQQYNPTAFKTAEEILIKHFFDSWTCCSAIKRPGRLVDVGAGAGFPGLALKIVRPDLEITLVEAVGKKARFIAECIDGLNLSNIQAEVGRAEDLGRKPGWRETYDYATCRAVGHLAIISEYCLPLLKRGGLLIAQKGREGEAEVKEASNGVRELGGRIEGIEWISLKEIPGRCLVLVRKVGDTPARFPRRVGIPAKRPLI
ncbi:MAG: 16S rRNA (guanine(527)-N(7))-methyltransferase RsmG [Syntrophomonadaceae bacterium]|nr:16S rRNA (guanine(527)-N(7))-methyltransferase RsmG [Syntrophomonadaceae bacterium]